MGVHEMDNDKAQKFLETGEIPDEESPEVFGNEAGEAVTLILLGFATAAKRKYLEDPQATFYVQEGFLDRANELHQKLLEKYAGPIAGEYQVETACVILWGSAVFMNFYNQPSMVKNEPQNDEATS